MAIRNTQALRGHLSGQTPVDNVMNDLESVNFILLNYRPSRYSRYQKN
ncbi:hypothetical protein [Klebsiella pneumoniae]